MTRPRTTHVDLAEGDRLIGISGWAAEHERLTGRAITATAARKQLERPYMPDPVIDEPGARRWSLVAVREAFDKANAAHAFLTGRE